MLFFVIALVILTGGGLCCVFVCGKSRQWPGVCICLAGAGCIAAAVISFALGQGSTDFLLPWQIPLAAFHLGLDPLSCFFLVPIALVCGLGAIYSRGYFSGQPAKTGRHGYYWCFYNLLFAAMLVVVTARNGILFLFAWEMMALTSFFLVIYDYRKAATTRAGWIYLVATHISTLFLLVLFLLLDRGGNQEFAGFSTAGLPLSLVLLLGLAGFGMKSGIVPFHTWLPEAHPAAPSPVSGVMSGVMIKTGIYGLLRLLTFTPDIPVWWGWVLILLGALASVFGVLSALAQHDIKRLLAYCSVENIGIIVLGMGWGVLGLSLRQPLLAVLGFAGCLLHVLNHGLFKSLLFFGAGSVLRSTGLSRIEAMGGLMKRMPVTGFLFLTGSVAICALPPLNGFISELMIYTASLSGLSGQQTWVLSLVALSSLAAAGALAALCFTKVCGIVFLGEPRSAEAAAARESGGSMLFPMLCLGGLCLAVGLAAPYLFPILLPVVYVLAGNGEPAGISDFTGILAKISLLLLLLILMTAVIAWLRQRLLKHRNVRQVPTWDCGYHAVTTRMQYSAASFADPVLKIFRALLGIRRSVELPADFFPARGKLSCQPKDIFNHWVYQPLYRLLSRIAGKLHWLKQGNTHLYVLYIAVTVILLLIWNLR